VGVQEVYENERRWLLSYSSTYLNTPLDGRGAWSDENGTPRCGTRARARRQRQRQSELTELTRPLEGTRRPRDQIKLPGRDWHWISKWAVAREGAVDDDGWEVRVWVGGCVHVGAIRIGADGGGPQYAVSWSTGWGAVGPASFVRRRKWTRQRMRIDPDMPRSVRLPCLPR
jgi:hypothetical protein